MNLSPFQRSQLFFAGIALVSLALMLLTETQSNALRFDRDAILAGEIWRLLTANVLHLGWGHLLMNLSGLLLVLFFFGRCLAATGWAIAFVFCSAFIAVAIIALHPDIRWYVGLSGTLHGLFVVGGLADTRVRPLEGWLFLGLIAAKLVWEQTAGSLPGSEQLAGGPVLTEAHLYGAIAGLLLWPVIRRLAKA